jgi:hypothetical protein
MRAVSRDVKTRQDDGPIAKGIALQCCMLEAQAQAQAVDGGLVDEDG